MHFEKVIAIIAMVFLFQLFIQLLPTAMVQS